ncbi:MAG: pimeloyl-ACP methyl ester esterase BioH [Gammaproteobacteria bacterium]|nr:pimeloyl-ACP methyl ester esterase BioH [Gammaproteobacteria bacterium]MBT8133055.1 pimeloyl-ACP methyl ester esterase BioH [Gammaproteobacteria bacterium]NNJ50895.1 pimeloyl-ACP methyl ester esterase BioH [Gammaproteobacteria bacterium]
MKPDSVTCVFVHGWAMNSAVWDDCIKLLPDWINVIVVDLPGHGSMAMVNADTLDDYVQSLIPLVHRPVLWVGWSLGGLAVLRLAELYPQRVAAAMLVTTNPCFVSRQGWDCAVDESVFKQFALDLGRDQQKTIRRFLALQVKGIDNVMNVVRQLQHSIQSRGMASTSALSTGLEILLDTDLRRALSIIDCPVHWLLGAKDSLVPAELAIALKEEYAQHDVTVLSNASHAPFISHAELFVEQLVSHAQQLRTSQV